MKDKRLSYIIASVVLLIILACAFFFIHMPNAQKLESKRAELTQKQAQLELVQKKVKELTLLKKDMQKLQDEKMTYEAKIPNEPDVPGMVNILEKIAQDSGVIVTAVDFSGEQQASADVPSIMVNACSVKITGSYRSITQYCDCIKNAPRLIGVKSIALNPTGEDGKDLNVSLDLGYFNYANATTSQPAAAAQPGTVNPPATK